MNFLEQLAAEWYEFNGYFVRSNVRLGNLERGGYTGECDVLAFDPKEKTLLHIETSNATFKKEVLRDRLLKQFNVASSEISSLFNFEIQNIKRIAIVGHAKKATLDLGNDIQVYSVPEFIRKISESMAEHVLLGRAIPEGYPLLRAMQFAYWWGTCKSKG